MTAKHDVAVMSSPKGTSSSTPTLPCQVVNLANVVLKDAVRRVKEQFFAKYGNEEIAKHFPDFEWARLSYAMELLPDGESILDVGTGRGHFINALGLEGRFPVIHGIDIKRYQYFDAMSDNYKWQIMNGAKMSFGDRQFDIVTCTEVLEHLETPILERVLAEVRRVARKKLMMMVPFDEPEPLPKFHKQKFDVRRLLAVFPEGKFHLLLKGSKHGSPWVLIDESY